MLNWLPPQRHRTDERVAGAQVRVRQHGEASMSKPDKSRVIHFAEAQAHIPGPNGERSINFLRRGSLDVNLSGPLPPNQQTPHAQDEVYIIIRGRGRTAS